MLDGLVPHFGRIANLVYPMAFGVPLLFSGDVANFPGTGR
jgi:hypothetical protein